MHSNTIIPVFQLFPGCGSSFEARQLRPVLHNLYELDDLVHVLPGGDEPLKHEDLEVSEHVARLSAHDVHVLLRQFEWRVLESDVFAR